MRLWQFESVAILQCGNITVLQNYMTLIAWQYESGQYESGQYESGQYESGQYDSWPYDSEAI